MILICCINEISDFMTGLLVTQRLKIINPALDNDLVVFWRYSFQFVNTQVQSWCCISLSSASRHHAVNVDLGTCGVKLVKHKYHIVSYRIVNIIYLKPVTEDEFLKIVS